VRMCLTSVVFPLPRKPVTTVTGKRASDECGAKAEDEEAVMGIFVRT